MRKKSIAVLLPFKDQFTKSKAGSASIWIKDFNKNLDINTLTEKLDFVRNMDDQMYLH